MLFMRSFAVTLLSMINRSGIMSAQTYLRMAAVFSIPIVDQKNRWLAHIVIVIAIQTKQSGRHMGIVLDLLQSSCVDAGPTLFYSYWLTE